jgi:NAD(P)-dependent dehydrogenase (short-subunit alcohol dehydrogenase family)
MSELTGKVAIVTGGNAGLGFRSALEFAKRGAQTVIACRRVEAGNDAAKLIRDAIPGAEVECIQLDLTDFESIFHFANVFNAKFDRLDILLNNAAVVNVEKLQHTQDGHEIHMATNYYGHFALAKRLFPKLVETLNARVVTVSSGANRVGEIRFDDMAWHDREYDRVKSYGDSKLANLLFTAALQKRFEEAGSSALSVAAHPGLTATERQQTVGVGGWVTTAIASPIETGVAPLLRAATDPHVKKGEYFGPRFGLRGGPVPQKVKGKALDGDLAEELWQFTENLIG